MATDNYKRLLSNPIVIRSGERIVNLENGLGLVTNLGVEDVSGLPGGCISTGVIHMPFVVTYKDTNTNTIKEDLEYTGLYDPKIIEEKIKNKFRQIAIDKHISPTEEDIQREIFIYKEDWKNEEEYSETRVLGNILYDYTTIYKPQLSLIKQEFYNCSSDQYFFIPLSFKSYPSNKGHANGILISKSKGTVYRIEPQTGIEMGRYPSKIDEGVRNLVNEIGLKDPTFKYIKVVCPQTIVRDKNCIFWTQLIFRELLKNLYKKEPDAVIQELSSKPKEQLESLVYEYKLRLFEILIPKFLKENGYQWFKFETNKNTYIREIKNEFALLRPGLPVQGAPPRLGGKTRRHKKVKRTRKIKKRQLANNLNR